MPLTLKLREEQKRREHVGDAPQRRADRDERSEYRPLHGAQTCRKYREREQRTEGAGRVDRLTPRRVAMHEVGNRYGIPRTAAHLSSLAQTAARRLVAFVVRGEK
jgi:hypothetical protein